MNAITSALFKARVNRQLDVHAPSSIPSSLSVRGFGDQIRTYNHKIIITLL